MRFLVPLALVLASCTPPESSFRCEDDSDCEAAFVCRQGDCRELAFPDAGVGDAGVPADGGALDGGALDAGAPADAGPGWPLAGFELRWVIDVAGVGSVVDGFPVPVRIDDGVLPAGVTRDGLRFTDDQGGPLVHEVERFSNPGESTAWVRLPTLPVGGTSFFLYATAGAQPPNAEDPAAVWVGHDAVVHLSEADEEATGNLPLPATTAGTSDRGGVFAIAQRFEAGSGSIEFGGVGGLPLLVGTNEATMSLWATADRVDAGAPTLDERWILSTVAVESSTPVSESRLLLEIREDYRTRATSRVQENTGFAQINSEPIFSDGSFHHILVRMRFAPALMELFINGVQHDTFHDFSDDVDAGTADASSFGFSIGSGRGANTRFAGAIDEVRVSSRWVPDGWVLAEYLAGTDALAAFRSTTPDERP
jgi:hypothetical protein